MVPTVPRHPVTKAGAVAAVVVLLLAASGSGRFARAATSTETRPNSVTVAVANTIPSLDPVLTDNATQVMDSIFDHLVQISPKGKLVPQLAMSWTHNANSTTWTFTLRPNARFSNGSAVTIQDVLYSFRAVRGNPKALIQGDILPMKTIKQSGANQVQFRLSIPYSSWPAQVIGVCIVPQKTYTSLGAAAFGRKPVGSGPYKVASYNGTSVRLEANRYYWGQKPAFKFVTVIPTLDQTARLSGLESGSLDLAPLVPAQASLARKHRNLRVVSAPGNQVVYLGFNIKNAPLDKVSIRQAIDYAIDRSGIIKTIMQGEGTPVGQMVAPVTFGYVPTIAPTPFDAAKAKSLLAKAGYKGETIPFSYPTDFQIPFENEIAQAIQGELSQVGLNVKLQGSTTNTFIGDWQGRRFPGIYMFSWAPSSMDADAILQGSYLPSSGVSYFTDPQIDKLTTQSEAQADPKRRLALIAQIWKVSKANVYYAPLFYSVNVYGMVKWLTYPGRADTYVVAQNIR